MSVSSTLALAAVTAGLSGIGILLVFGGARLLFEGRGARSLIGIPAVLAGLSFSFAASFGALGLAQIAATSIR